MNGDRVTLSWICGSAVWIRYSSESLTLPSLPASILLLCASLGFFPPCCPRNLLSLSGRFLPAKSISVATTLPLTLLSNVAVSLSFSCRFSTIHASKSWILRRVLPSLIGPPTFLQHFCRSSSYPFKTLVRDDENAPSCRLFWPL